MTNESKPSISKNNPNALFPQNEGVSFDLPQTQDLNYFRSIAENQEELIVRFDLAGKITYVNRAFCDASRISRIKLIGRKIYSVFSSRMMPTLYHSVKELLIHPQYFILDEDASLMFATNRWIQWVGFPIRDEQENIFEIQAVGRDITNLKRSEETVQIQRDLALLQNEPGIENSWGQKLFECLGSLISFSFFALYSFDEKQETFQLINSRVKSSESFILPASIIKDSPADKVFQNPVLSAFPIHDKEFLDNSIKLPETIHNLSIVPFIQKGKTIAVFLFGSTYFTDLPDEIKGQLLAIQNCIANFLEQIQLKSSLVEQQSILQDLFRSLDQMLLVFDQDGTVFEVNQTFLDQIPKNSIKLKQTKIFDLHPPEYREKLTDTIKKLKKEKQSNLQLPLLTCEGKLIDIEAIFQLSSTKGVTKIIAFYKDISQQLRLQELEKEQKEFASKLVNLTGVLNSSLDLDIILDKVIKVLEDVIPTATYNIMRIDGNEARIIRQHGYQQMGTNELLDMRLFDLTKFPIFLQIIKNKQEVLIPETQHCPDWKPVPESFWVRSYMCAPIVINDQVFGFINCDCGTPNGFTETHASRLKQVADQAAIAIENAKIYTETKRRLKQIALINEITQSILNSDHLSDIFKKIPEKILSTFDADSLVITDWDPEKKSSTRMLAYGNGVEPNLPKTSAPNEPTFTEKAINARHALVISAESDPIFWGNNSSRVFTDQHILALPVISQENSMGAILVGFKNANQITPDIISIAEYASLQIATILYRSNLFKESSKQSAAYQHANGLIASLSIVATSILSTKDINDIMQTMGNGLEKMKIHSMLFFKDPAFPNLYLDYCSLQEQLDSQLEALRNTKKRITLLIPDSEEIHKPLEDQQTVFVDDSVKLFKLLIPGKYGPFSNKFMDALEITPDSKGLLLPLVVEKKTVGMLGIYGKDLQEIDLRAGEIFISQISVAMDNARLLAEIQRLAITDELTNIYNRRGLFEFGNQEFAISKRLNTNLGCLMIDLDSFKEINDRYGHAVGDEALQEITKRIMTNIREIDIFGRYGGEEFVVLLIANDLHSSSVVAERIRRAVADQAIETKAGPIHVTISIGVDEFDSCCENLDTLINRADRAMYIAKHNGRNQIATLMNQKNIQC
jgi:diguanylate cyclase (GGDEF)-like protein/PAS domain S-box-containing protein